MKICSRCNKTFDDNVDWTNPNIHYSGGNTDVTLCRECERYISAKVGDILQRNTGEYYVKTKEHKLMVDT